MGATRPNVPDYRLFELERRAEDVLKDCSACVRGRRVDIERLIQEKFGVLIDAFHGLRSVWDTYAFVNVTGNCIWVDADLIDDPAQEKKYRFTLAEELAHILIYKELFTHVETVEDRMRLERALGEDAVDRLDRQARALAGALLMPKSSIEPLTEELAGKMKQERGEIDVDELATRLAHEFDVNFRAVKKRLKSLGYHKNQRLGLNLD